jgi:formylmethanofuran dehydrogenase subunit E
VTGRCPCDFCNASDDPASCTDCNHVFTEHEEWNVDGAGNPMCFECYEKMSGQPKKEEG